METLRNAMTQCDGTGPIQNAIILTIARRIFQPSESENNSMQNTDDISGSKEEREESYIENGVEKLKDFPKSNHITPSQENSKDNTGLPGCNPVIERLTGQSSLEKSKYSSSDIYSYCRTDLPQAFDDKIRGTYCTALKSSQNESVIIEGEYDPSLKKVKDPYQNDIETSNVAPAGSE